MWRSVTPGPFIDKHQGMTLLHLAAALGYAKLVRTMLTWKAENSNVILEAEIDALSQDKDGYTPLVSSASSKSIFHAQTCSVSTLPYLLRHWPAPVATPRRRSYCTSGTRTRWTCATTRRRARSRWRATTATVSWPASSSGRRRSGSASSSAHQPVLPFRRLPPSRRRRRLLPARIPPLPPLRQTHCQPAARTTLPAPPHRRPRRPKRPRICSAIWTKAIVAVAMVATAAATVVQLTVKPRTVITTCSRVVWAVICTRWRTMHPGRCTTSLTWTKSSATARACTGRTAIAAATTTSVWWRPSIRPSRRRVFRRTARWRVPARPPGHRAVVGYTTGWRTPTPIRCSRTHCHRTRTATAAMTVCSCGPVPSTRGMFLSAEMLDLSWC